MTTTILRPTANGDLSEASHQFPAAGEHWDKVKEVVADEDATYLYGWPGLATDYRELYELPSLPPAVAAINYVRVYARFKEVGGTGSGYCGLKTGGLTQWGNRNLLGGSYVTYSYPWATNPQTGVAWTVADINALQAGGRLAHGGGGGQHTRFTQVYVVVDYDPILAPTETTDPATDVAANSSTLNGTLDADGGEACDCGFQWGETVAYGNTTPTQSRTTGQTFAQPISGLILGITYHFRAFATNAAGTTYGADRTFTTVVLASTVTTDPATALSAIAATLNGTLDDDGGEACECGFEWGLDTGYGTSTPPQSKTTGETFSQVIGGLSAGTTYHFRAFATNAAGTTYGADSTFGTALLMSRAYSLERRQL